MMKTGGWFANILKKGSATYRVSFVVGKVRYNVAVPWFVPCQAGHQRTSLHLHHAHIRLCDVMLRLRDCIPSATRQHFVLYNHVR